MRFNHRKNENKMRKNLCFLVILLTSSTMNSQNLNPRISSSGIANNQINFIVGVINVELIFGLSKVANVTTTSSTLNLENNYENDNILNNNLIYYPNPTNEKVFISSKNLTPEIEFEVYNNIGQLLIKQKLINDYIDFSRFVKGIYLIVPISEQYLPFKIIKN